MTATPNTEQDPLVRLAARRPQAVCATLDLEPATRELLADDPAPAALLSALIQAELLVDALTYLAHALPPADAVAWACACVPLERELGADAQAALKAAEAWCMGPTEEHSRTAEAAAEACSDMSAQLVAQAAFCGGGNIAPVGLEPVPTPPGLVGTAVSGALRLAAAEALPADIPERHRRFLSHGILDRKDPDVSAVQHESDAANSYDVIPYESNPFPFTTPEYLASIAGLFGLEGVDPARCRVLELGCASGGNLLPLAANFPDSHFVGIDASSAQVADGAAAIAGYGLANIELLCADILTWKYDGPPFDYVICHGVYSWVPDAVQTRILELCREVTHPRSICYVSYNTYPGWHLRGSVREMMHYHARGFDDDRERISQSRALLKFLVEAAPAEGAYGQLLREELDVLKDRDDSYLFHEHLEVNNTPLYFYQFAERMAAAGLRYLGEASLNSMLPHGFSPEVQTTLARIAPDLIRHEQYLDFLRNRTFRRTLMCHEETPLERDILASRVADYRVSAILRADPPEEGAEHEGPTFTHASGARITVQEPLERGVLEVLAREMPAAVPVSTLVAEAAAKVGLAADDPFVAHKVGGVVLECAANGIAELYRYPDRFTLELAARPRVAPFTRWQLEHQGWATNQRHVRVEPPPLERALALLCDGTRERPELEATLGAKVVSGDLLMYLDGERLQDPARVAELMPRGVERALRSLAAHMLLVP